MYPDMQRVLMYVCTVLLQATCAALETMITPDCGTRVSVGTPLIIGGVPTKRGEVPWHAGIYTKLADGTHEQICGGSLINHFVVLSAAHCFWDYSVMGKHPEDQFAVAVGKIYRAWNDPYDEAQKSDVKKVYLPEHYRGSIANEQADLAVVVVTSPFTFQTHVRPVCVDFNATIQEKQLQPGEKGMVAGWGLTSINGQASDTLKVVELPNVNASACITGSPYSFQGYITIDKICAGAKDGTAALCMGDSGGGLAFPRTTVTSERYFLRGIVYERALLPPRDSLRASATSSAG